MLQPLLALLCTTVAVGFIGVRARGLREGLQLPLSRALPSFFRQTLNFSGRSQQPKMNKKNLLNSKNGIHSVQQDEVPEIKDFW